MIPYFESLGREKRVCPDCLRHSLRLEPSALNPLAAVWRCDGCGWFQTVMAPENAGVEADRVSRIVRIDFGK